MSALLELNNIECQYEGQSVVRGLSVHVNKGSVACLLGPSGCGKSTVLRAIAGFEPVIDGEISIRGTIVSRPGYMLAPEKRKLGLVFQDHALFPHMDVNNNICFGLRSVSVSEKKKTTSELLDLVGLAGYGERYPHELSGGQQQRVALARAMATKPDLMLLDEPFSSLDVDLRDRLGQEVRNILKIQGITTLLVTHDQQEAFALGDMVGILHEGHIIQWDTPFNLYHEPANRFVADFIGQGVLMKGTLRAADTVETEVGIIRGNRAYPWPKDSEVDVLIRPDDIVPDPDSSLFGTVIDKAFKGAEIMYTLKLKTGSVVLSLFPSHYLHEVGETVGIRIAADHLVAFPHQV